MINYCNRNTASWGVFSFARRDSWASGSWFHSSWKEKL